MKKLLWLITMMGVLALLGAKDLTQPALGGDAVQAVLKQHEQFLHYAQQLDADKMYELVLENDKGTIIQNAQLQTRQEALESTKKGFAGLKKIEYKFSEQHVKVISSEVAVFTGKGQTIAITTSDNTYTSDFAVTSVFVLKDGQWKIIHGHFSSPSM
jgi:hypothetical protein